MTDRKKVKQLNILLGGCEDCGSFKNTYLVCKLDGTQFFLCSGCHRDMILDLCEQGKKERE